MNATEPMVRLWHVTHKDQPKHGGFITDKWYQVQEDIDTARTEGEGEDNVVVTVVMWTQAAWQAMNESDDEFGGW